MTYSESARGVMITPRRAFKELIAHHMTFEDWQAFEKEYGVRAMYDAGDVMDFLGY